MKHTGNRLDPMGHRRSEIEWNNTQSRSSRPISLPSLKCCYGDGKVTYLDGSLMVDGQVVSVRKGPKMAGAF